MFSTNNSLRRFAQSLAIATSLCSVHAKPEVELKAGILPPIPLSNNIKTDPYLAHEVKPGDNVFSVAKGLELNTNYTSLYRYLKKQKILNEDGLKTGQKIRRVDFHEWESSEARKFSDRTKFIPAEGKVFYYKIKRGDQLEKIHQQINQLLEPEDRPPLKSLIKFNNFINTPAAVISSKHRIIAGQTLLFPQYQSDSKMYAGHPFFQGLSPETLKQIDHIFTSSLANNLSLSQLIDSSGYDQLNIKHREAIIKIITSLVQHYQIDTCITHRDLLPIVNPNQGIGKLLAGQESEETLQLILKMINEGPVDNLKISPVQAIGKIIYDLSDWQTNFHQGFNGTCAPTSVTLELAEHYPLKLLNLISDLYTKGQAKYQDVTDPDYPQMISLTPIIATTPLLQEVSKNPRWLQVLLQASMMEYANGANIYNLAQDCHQSPDLTEKLGYGASMTAMSSILTLITKDKYAVYPPPVTESEILALSKIAKTQPVLLSLAWRHLSEPDIKKLVTQKGGSKSSYQNEEGYSLHAVAFHGYDSENKLVLIINPHSNDHQDRDLKNLVSDKTEIKRYAWGAGIQGIPLEEYQLMSKQVVRARQANELETINWAFAIDLKEETIKLKDDDWKLKLFFDKSDSDFTQQDWFRQIFRDSNPIEQN